MLVAVVILAVPAADVPAPIVVPAAADGTPTRTADPWQFHGDGQLEIDRGQAVMTYRRGLVARFGQRLIMADAARIARGAENAVALWVSGRVLYVQPGIRIEADRLGLRSFGLVPTAGEAWQVDARFSAAGGRTVRATAAHARFEADRITLSQVHLDFGHGGLVGLDAPTVVIHLRDPKDTERIGVPWRPVKDDPLHQRLNGIEAYSATTTVAGLPVLWLPWLYRDFRYDWPWTRYELGSSRRQGWFARMWLGSDLPEIFGWRPRIELRGDQHTASGSAFGAYLRWVNPALGRGEATWYEMPREHVLGGSGGKDGLATRRARVVDVEQRLRLPGIGVEGSDLGAGALAARWTALPNADPTQPGDDGAGRPPDERFRADYLRRDLDQRPLARRSLAAAWGLPWIEAAADTQRNPNDFSTGTERWWGGEIAIPRTAVGPLYLDGHGWAEALRRPTVDTQATRIAAEAALGFVHWFDGLGLDARGGVRSLSYFNGQIAAQSQRHAEERHLGFLDAGARLRLENTYVTDDGRPPVVHALTPRVGFELDGDGIGLTLPTYGFGDARDVLTEDQRWLVTGLGTTVARSWTAFRADVTARWGWRSRERTYFDDDGQQQRSRTPLADVTLSAEGRPWSDAGLGCQGVWDARPGRWRTLDVWSWWAAHERLTLNYGASLLGRLPNSGADRRWEHRPGATFKAERYRFSAGTTLRPGGRPVDSWRIGLVRTMVDGDLLLSTEYLYGPGGGLVDRRFGIRFTLGGNHGSSESEEGLPSEHVWAVR
ncbi:hypothetical protein LBMAG53_00440 [Planctomycetota bacterium]|nr:hypothetical protein LBMAG53_00440 [Planctomycetota bacterium]